MARITQGELAKRLGFSQQAVSFALNGGGTLSQATRDRILAEAEKLGYRRNNGARTMLTGRTGSLALVGVEGLRSFMPHSLIAGASGALEDIGCHLVIHPMRLERLDDPSYVPRIMRELAVDGLLVLYEGRGENRLREWLKRYRIPSVWINRKEQYNCAHPDDFKLGREGTRKLLDLGHRRIWWLGSEPSPGVHYSVADRADGYASAMRDAGLSPIHKTTTDLPDDGSWLRGPDAPSACLCYTEEDGELAYIAAARAGVLVPGQLSIIVIGSAMAHVGRVPFCTLRIPFHQVGVEAVRMLEKRIASGGRSLRTHAEGQIQFDEGKTAGPAP